MPFSSATFYGWTYRHGAHDGAPEPLPRLEEKREQEQLRVGPAICGALVHRPPPQCVCAQWCPTLCDPLDCCPRGSSVRGISRQEHWSGLPRPPPGDLPDPGIEPASLVPPALAGGLFTNAPRGEPCPHTPRSIRDYKHEWWRVIFF